MQLSLSQKQKTALDLLNDPSITEIYYGGAAGGGKSLIVCLWMLLECRNYPGIRIGLGRKELTRLKQTTVTTLLREAHPLLNVPASTFNYQEQKGLITYVNGSSIQLFDLIRQPSDPDFDTLGSLNLTHVVIEESGEIVKKAKDVFGSRKNRFLNTEYNIVGKTVMTGNPSQNFTRSEYYDPYIKMGGGDSQKWENGDVEVNGKMVKAYNAFIKSLPTDNPFLPRNYIEVLKKLPPPERRRLFEGNWDYADDDSMLIKSYIFDRSLIGELKEGKKTIGVDVADTGKDSTIVSLVEDNILVAQKSIKVKTYNETAVSEQTALEIIRFAQENGFDSSKAKDIGIDTIGVGVGVRDFMRRNGWYIQEFIAGSRSEGNYKNKRSEAYWELAQGMDSGKYKIYNQLETKDELRRQLMAHEYTVEDKVVRILPKDKVKEALGYSPDHSDSAVIAFYVQNAQTDARYNTKRIVF